MILFVLVGKYFKLIFHLLKNSRKFQTITTSLVHVELRDDKFLVGMKMHYKTALRSEPASLSKLIALPVERDQVVQKSILDKIFVVNIKSRKQFALYEVK